MKSPTISTFLLSSSLSGFNKITIFTILLFGQFSLLCAQQADPAADEQAALVQKRRNIAVALNYCRASFHRIRKYPTDLVIAQEEQKILNNLNLSGIQDEEIIRLYTDVLDEIGQIKLSDKETDLYETKYKRAVRQELAFDSLAIGLDLLTAQYLGAVRTGARSWWDYRSHQWNRDNEVFKLEKNRMNSVMTKSSNFLDTFWRLTQENNIPDRWLVRSTDLDELERAMNENDLEVRLRILKRMEAYMECYPPYWYYVARTEQGLGDLVAAVGSYEELAHLGTDHFRRDDMLASAFANQAVIQAHLGQGNPLETAQRALSHSTQVWEANLACARILQRAGKLADAEDAILRNLDVGLEKEQSTVTLLTFYHDTNNNTKLAKYLGKEETLAHVPPPVLIRLASNLSADETPPLVWTALASSMRIYPQVGLGDDDVLVVCHPVWQIDRSQLTLRRDDGTSLEGELFRQGDADVIRFANVADFGGILRGPSQLPPLKVELKYGETNPIQLAFSDEELPGTEVNNVNGNPVSKGEKSRSYHLIAAQWGDRGVAYMPKFPTTAAIYPPQDFDKLIAAFIEQQDEIKAAEQKKKKETTIR